MSSNIIYVAGSWENREFIKKITEYMKNSGYNVNSTWSTRETSKRDSRDSTYHAHLDLKEIDEADILLALMDDPKYEYRGTFTEIGYALGRGKKVLVYCPFYTPDPDFENIPAKCMSNIFFWHPNIEYFTDLSMMIHFLAPE
jgi:nucleoside 2-deoxyribosyltransferase